MEGKRIPNTVLHTRVRDDLDGSFHWADVSTDEVFSGRKVVVFGLPGAFTPACSETHLPGFEALHDDILAQGVDEVICTAVNDAFVMFQWAKSLGVDKVRMLPDGNGTFAEAIGMLVSRSEQGMGMRSWRYAMLVDNGVVEKLLCEPDLRDNPPGVPVANSDAQKVLDYLKSR